MPSGKSPAFRFYAADFIADEKVRLMDYEAIGVYIILLSNAWIQGSIPADPEELARMMRLPVKQFESIWKQIVGCWRAGEPGRLVQPRLELERGKQEEHAQRARQNGTHGGRPRKRSGFANDNPEETQSEPRVNPAGYFWDPSSYPRQKLARTRFSFSFSFSLSDYLASLDANRERLGAAFPSRGLAFSAWFVARGLLADAVPPDRALDFDATVFSQSISDAQALVDSYAAEELEARTARFFAAIVAAEINRLPATVTSFRRAIDWPAVTGRVIEITRNRPGRELSDGSVNGKPVDIPAELRR